MRYLNILLACAAEPWAMHRDKLHTVTQFLLFKAAGGQLSDAEVQARITEKSRRETASTPGSVGVIPIYGMMAQRMNLMDDVSGDGGTSTDMTINHFRAALADDQIKAIVFDIDSPGGSVYGVEELAQEIYAARGIKPIVAQVNSVAASAAYWAATQADEVVVTPGGRAGSIGVYSIHEDISQALEKAGIKETIVASHPNKILGNEFEPLGAEARKEMEDRVAESNSTFTRAVARGRGVTQAVVNDKFGNGKTFNARQLVKLGMADRVGTLTDTLERFGAQVRSQAQRDHAKALSVSSEATLAMVKKLSAGDQLTRRELEHGLKGLGLSNSEAERAVRECFPTAQGDPGEKAVNQVVKSQLTDMSKMLDQISLQLIGETS